MSSFTLRPRTPERISSLLALALACGTGRGLAAEDSRKSSGALVAVSSFECSGAAFPFDAFVASLRVELAGTGLACCVVSTPAETAPTSAYLVIELEASDCASPNVRIDVRARDRPSPLEREISLDDVEEVARPRALALAVAELIRSLSEEPPEKPPTPDSVPPREPSALVGAPSSARATGYALHVEAELRSYPKRDTTPWGGRLGFGIYRSWIHAEADAGFGLFRRHTNLGELFVRSINLGLGAGLRVGSSSVGFELGPRAELGCAWIRGTTTLDGVATGSGSGVVVNVGVRAALDVRLLPAFVPRVAFETGAVVRGMNGNVDGEPSAGVGGYYLIGAVGMAVPL